MQSSQEVVVLNKQDLGGLEASDHALGDGAAAAVVCPKSLGQCLRGVGHRLVKPS